MNPQEPQTAPEMTPSEAVSEALAEAALPTEIHEPAPQNQADQPVLDASITSSVETPHEATSLPIPRVFFGAALLGISALSVVLIIVAYMIPVTPSDDHSQAASAVQAAAIPDAFEGMMIEGKSAYVLDLTSGKVLFEKDASLQLPLASITKVPMALAVAEVLGQEEVVTISRRAVERSGGGLTWGEEWKVKDLIDFTLIASSNTGAEALAEAADEKLRAKYSDAPHGRAAVWRMNNLAHELDLSETYFLNPSGLDESTTQAGALGSARDVADLFRYAIQSNRQLFEGTTRETMYLAPINFDGTEAQNTNQALSTIPHLVLGKTGYTDLAGGNLAIVFEPEPGHPVAVVVLGSSIEGRFDDVKRLVSATEIAVSNLR